MAASGNERLGIFGGSFDPPHCAHLALARSALDELHLDRVYWLPAGRPWQKERVGRTLAPAEDRAAMVAAAIADEPRFVLDRRELDRDGPSYTIDSVLALQAEHPGAELFLLLGQDQFARLPSWHRWRELVDAVTLAVATRADAAGSGDLPAMPPALAAAAKRVQRLGMPAMTVSSTQLRTRLAAGQSTAELAGTVVPERVARYIDSHHLYRAAARPLPGDAPTDPDITGS